MQRQRFSVDHHINRFVEIELDAARLLALCQTMIYMGSVIQSTQIPHQPRASDRPPADEVHQSVIGHSRGRDHHRAPSEFTVVETEKQTWAPVVRALSSDPNRERPA